MVTRREGGEGREREGRQGREGGGDNENRDKVLRSHSVVFSILLQVMHRKQALWKSLSEATARSFGYTVFEQTWHLLSVCPPPALKPFVLALAVLTNDRLRRRSTLMPSWVSFRRTMSTLSLAPWYSSSPG